jgi:hypothetical protein
MTTTNGVYANPGVASPVYGQNQVYTGMNHSYQNNSGYGSPQQGMSQPGSPNPNAGYGYAQPKPVGNMAGLDPGKMNSQQILNTLRGIYIKQKMSLSEVLTGYNTANKYQVFELSDSGTALKKPIFQCVETSDCCNRNCVSPECRAISLDITKVPMDVDYEGEVVFKLVRECQCTCLCLNRPEMKVYYVEGGQNHYLGRVYDPWDCCSNNYEVFDANNNQKFHVEADCCQLGFICKCPCESCENIEFKLWSGKKERQEQSLMKRGAGNCGKNAISVADNFALPFPQNSTWEDKALLLALTLMIDFLMFEEPHDTKSSHRGGYSAF